MGITNNYIDSHCHILPGVDHGAKDEKVASEITSGLIEAGFSSVVATPHFYCHEESVDEFIARRNKSLDNTRISEQIKIYPAAEVALETGVSKKCDLSKLTIGNTDRILIELPMKSYSHSISEEIFDIKVRHGLTPVIAHLERYVGLYSNDDFSDIFAVEDIICQISLFSMVKMKERRFFKKLYATGIDIITGTDAHSYDFRITDSVKGMKKLSKLLPFDEYEKVLSCSALGLK